MAGSFAGFPLYPKLGTGVYAAGPEDITSMFSAFR